MNFMKKYLLLILLIAMTLPVIAQEALEKAINNKDWPALAADIVKIICRFFLPYKNSNY